MLERGICLCIKGWGNFAAMNGVYLQDDGRWDESAYGGWQIMVTSTGGLFCSFGWDFHLHYTMIRRIHDNVGFLCLAEVRVSPSSSS